MQELMCYQCIFAIHRIFYILQGCKEGSYRPSKSTTELYDIHASYLIIMYTHNVCNVTSYCSTCHVYAMRDQLHLFLIIAHFQDITLAMSMVLIGKIQEFSQSVSESPCIWREWNCFSQSTKQLKRTRSQYFC